MGQGDQLVQCLPTKINPPSLEEDSITQSPYRFLPAMSNTQANGRKHANKQPIHWEQRKTGDSDTAIIVQ